MIRFGYLDFKLNASGEQKIYMFNGAISIGHAHANAHEGYYISRRLLHKGALMSNPNSNMFYNIRICSEDDFYLPAGINTQETIFWDSFFHTRTLA